MGKSKRLCIVKTGGLEQQNTEVEPHTEEQQANVNEATDNVQSDSGPPKKVRRHTVKQAIWDLESDERIEVTFNELGQPVGDEGKEFTSFLGTLVKMSNHLSIEYLHWRTIPEDKKDDLWNLVKGRFIFVPAENDKVKDWVLSDMGIKFKSWKYELKKKWFDSSSTINGIVAAQNDPRVDKEQFKKLVTYWFKDKVQVESEMKRKIRGKFKEPHVIGTKSFARLIHDETKKTGVRPSRGKVYCLTRTRENGDIVNEVATEVVGKLKSLENGSTSSTKGVDLNWKNDDLAKVKGPEKGGRVRCLGKVVIAKDKGSCLSQDPQIPVLKARINELEDKMKEMDESKERQDAEMKELKDRQEVMIQFMALIKDQLPNSDLANIFKGLNTQVASDSSSVYNHSSTENPTSSRASHNSS
uniref:uncharacterized protein LOC122597140 n=1 Tax=Erigeron canadensis TaxID=72917 RepID=UPI001CB8EDE0|nr:uncharacterized protein LOC122597140 [Erigeron canadensis]